MPLLILAIVLGLAAGADGARAQEAHLAPDKFVDDCSSCHRGHGMSGTSMLARAGDDACLGCHGSQAASSGQRLALGLTSSARPRDIEAEIRKPVIHRGALCTECHSVHGVQARPKVADDRLTLGIRKASPRRGFTDEADLCMSCHGGTELRVEDPSDIGVLLDPSNPSYHPLLALGASEGGPSLLPPLTGTSLINCTDCHRSDDPTGPRGPHGSRVPGLLGAEYAVQDGQVESPATYALCYACHDREIVLSDSSSFPLHAEHVVEDRTPCNFCHNPHGATAGRALVLFNEPTSLTGVNPSGSGRLEYLSSAVGTGSCYLTCHGKDHDPLGYGMGVTDEGRPLLDDGPSDTEIDSLAPAGVGARGRSGSEDQLRPTDHTIFEKDVD